MTDANEILQLQKAVKEIYVDPLIKQYIVELVERDAGARGGLPGREPARLARAVPHLARRSALLEGRDFVTPDDVKELALVTLGAPGHREPRARR